MSLRHSPLAVLVILLALCGCWGCADRSAGGSEAARPAEPRKPPAATVEVPQPARQSALPKRNSADGPKDVTFDDIKLDLKKGDPYDPVLLTQKIKDLDGTPIRIRGYILPSFKQTDIVQFVLVRDNQECCFGPGALLHDCVLVEMTPPAAATFTTRPVSVEGTFSIREVKLDGRILAIYHLDGTAVK